MKLKQTNKGYKCPICKELSLDELPNDTIIDHAKSNSMVGTITERVYNESKLRKFKCRLCLGNFDEIE